MWSCTIYAFRAILTHLVGLQAFLLLLVIAFDTRAENYFISKDNIPIIFTMASWEPLYPLWGLCSNSYRAGLFLADFWHL